MFNTSCLVLVTVAPPNSVVVVVVVVAFFAPPEKKGFVSSLVLHIGQIIQIIPDSRSKFFSRQTYS